MMGILLELGGVAATSDGISVGDPIQ